MSKKNRKGEVQMDVQEKIDLINTLNDKVIDCDCDGETCYYVLARLDNEVKNVLNTLGKDDNWINCNKEYEHKEGYFIDISQVGFEFANWYQESTGFSII